MSKTKSPFELLLDDSEATTTAVSTLDFGKLLKSNDKRKSPRSRLTGYAILFDLDGEPLTRGVLRNISLGGISLETHPVRLAPNSYVFLELSGTGTELGQLKCRVNWIATMDAHPKKHKIMGLQFETKSAEIRAKYEKFVRSLNAKK